MTSSFTLEFDDIPEGSGGTVEFDRENPRLLGTTGCMTCVGVYFKIDDTRCFIAHINGYSDTTYPSNFLLEEGGNRMAEKVHARLRGHARKNQWNFFHEEFGKHLRFICPYIERENQRHGFYKRAGFHVVEGVREFLKDAGRKLLDAARQARPPSNTQLCSSDRAQDMIFNRSRAEITLQGNTLIFDAVHEGVDRKSHGCVVSPGTGNVRSIGDMLPQGALPKPEEELGNYNPQHGYLDLGDWSFRIEGEDYLEFPPYHLNRHIEWNMKEHKKREAYRNDRDGHVEAEVIQAIGWQSPHQSDKGSPNYKKLLGRKP